MIIAIIASVAHPGYMARIILTCYVINRVETDSELSDFEWILGLHALLHVLNALPVFVVECCVVVGEERGTLKPFEVMMNY